MKKILLASTALVVTAGIAAADVKVSGDGRMGVLYTEDGFANALTGDTKDWSFTSRLRIKFSASGETDGGLTFGGSMRIDQEDQDTFTASDSNNDGNLDTVVTNSGDRASNGTAGSVFISSDTLGTLSMGDVDGAAESVVGDLAGVGLTGLADQNEFIYLFGGNDPSALYSYTNSGFTLAFSVSDDEEYSVGLGYDGGMWGASIGYEKLPEGGTVQIQIDDQNINLVTNTSTELDQVIGQAYVTFSGVTLKGAYGRIDGDTYADQYGVSAEYAWDAFSVTGYWREIDFENAGKGDAYGIGGAYDLGGGASVVAGIADINDNTVADFGLKFSF